MINLRWNSVSLDKLKEHLSTILHGDIEILIRFVKYRNLIKEIPLPRQLDEIPIEYNSQATDDTLCGSVFLNILSQKENKEKFNDKIMMADLMPKVVQFIKDIGKKCDENNSIVLTNKMAQR